MFSEKEQRKIDFFIEEDQKLRAAMQEFKTQMILKGIKYKEILKMPQYISLKKRSEEIDKQLEIITIGEPVK